MAVAINKSPELKDYINGAGESTLVMVEFYATWCKPCREIKPIIDKLAKEHAKRLLVLTVDVDERDELALSYGISAMPTMIFIRNGAELGKVTGGNGAKLVKALKKYLAD